MFKPNKLLHLLIVLIALLSACTGNSAATGTPAPANQDFQTSITGGEIALRYPSGWVTTVVNGQIIVANSQAALDAASPSGGQFVARMVVGPIKVLSGLSETSTSHEVIQFFAASLATTGIKFSDPTDLRIGTFTASRIAGNSSDGDGSITAVDMNQGIYNIVSVVSAAGEMGKFEQTLWNILASVTYTPPVQTGPQEVPIATAEASG
jgi:hypothetical protein